MRLRLFTPVVRHGSMSSMYPVRVVVVNVVPSGRDAISFVSMSNYLCRVLLPWDLLTRELKPPFYHVFWPGLRGNLCFCGTNPGLRSFDCILSPGP